MALERDVMIVNKLCLGSLYPAVAVKALMPQPAPAPGGTAFAGEVFTRQHNTFSGFCIANGVPFLVWRPA